MSKRNLDLKQLSIANIQLCSLLSLIERSRNNEVDFYRYVAQAKKYQGDLVEMEIELKSQLRDC